MRISQIFRGLGQRLRVAGSVMMDGMPRAGGISTSAELAAYLYGRRSKAGVMVSDETAWKISVINTCTRILAEGVASLPLNVFKERPDGGKERDRGSRLDRMLHLKPNRWQTSMEWREMMMVHAVRRGNAFSLRLKIDGEDREFIPYHPDKMKWGLFAGKMWYEYTNPEGRQIPYSQEQIFHLRGLSSDGVSGRDMIEDLRDSLGISQSHEDWESASYARGGTKRPILNHPNVLNEQAAKRIRDSWVENYGGEEGMWKPVLLEEGMKLENLDLSAADLQFLESRKFRIAELARPFRVPLHMLNELDRSTNNNIEHQGLEFLIYTLTPWLVRWEQRFQVDLIGDDDTRFAKHNVNGLLRGDVQKRAEYYSKALTNGWMNKDEVRALEDMNPIPGGAGQRFMEPANVQEAGTVRSQPAPAGEQK